MRPNKNMGRVHVTVDTVAYLMPASDWLTGSMAYLVPASDWLTGSMIYLVFASHRFYGLCYAWLHN